MGGQAELSSLPISNKSTMAARVTKSAIDWTAFAKRVPEWQLPAFRALKARSDMFVQRVHKYPEAMPAIDWAAYKAKVCTPGVVDALQKAYENTKVPYPTDTADTHAKIAKAERVQQVWDEATVEEMQKEIDLCARAIDLVDKIPPPGSMTVQEYFEYFPETFSYMTEPTVWPHRLCDQPGGTDRALAESWDRLPTWRQKKDGTMRNPLAMTHRDFEPLNHDEAYAEWCVEKAEEQVARKKNDKAPAEELKNAQKLVNEARAVVLEQREARKKAYDELDAWRAAGSKL